MLKTLTYPNFIREHCHINNPLIKINPQTKGDFLIPYLILKIDVEDLIFCESSLLILVRVRDLTPSLLVIIRLYLLLSQQNWVFQLYGNHVPTAKGCRIVHSWVHSNLTNNSDLVT